MKAKVKKNNQLQGQLWGKMKGGNVDGVVIVLLL